MELKSGLLKAIKACILGSQEGSVFHTGGIDLGVVLCTFLTVLISSIMGPCGVITVTSSSVS